MDYLVGHHILDPRVVADIVELVVGDDGGRPVEDVLVHIGGDDAGGIPSDDVRGSVQRIARAVRKDHNVSILGARWTPCWLCHRVGSGKATAREFEWLLVLRGIPLAVFLAVVLFVVVLPLGLLPVLRPFSFGAFAPMVPPVLSGLRARTQERGVSFRGRVSIRRRNPSLARVIREESRLHPTRQRETEDDEQVDEQRDRRSHGNSYVHDDVVMEPRIKHIER